MLRFQPCTADIEAGFPTRRPLGSAAFRAEGAFIRRARVKSSVAFVFDPELHRKMVRRILIEIRQTCTFSTAARVGRSETCAIEPKHDSTRTKILPDHVNDANERGMKKLIDPNQWTCSSVKRVLCMSVLRLAVCGSPCSPIQQKRNHLSNITC